MENFSRRSWLLLSATLLERSSIPPFILAVFRISPFLLYKGHNSYIKWLLFFLSLNGKANWWMHQLFPYLLCSINHYHSEWQKLSLTICPLEICFKNVYHHLLIPINQLVKNIFKVVFLLSFWILLFCWLYHEAHSTLCEENNTEGNYWTLYVCIALHRKKTRASINLRVA